MTEIAAALVKELRDRTGAGMMECKRALQETNGDIEAAQRLLRERGAAQAQKRAGRETSEGIVLMRAHEDRGALELAGTVEPAPDAVKTDAAVAGEVPAE